MILSAIESFVVFVIMADKENYFCSVVSMVRPGDWLLHLTMLKSFMKYFLACDRLNYTRMISLYPEEIFTDCRVLPKSDPAIYEEFLSGN